MQENFPSCPRAAFGWETQPSKAQHPHEFPRDSQEAFSSLAKKRVTTTTTPATFPSHQEPGEEEQQQHKPFGAKIANSSSFWGKLNYS